MCEYCLMFNGHDIQCPNYESKEYEPKYTCPTCKSELLARDIVYVNCITGNTECDYCHNDVTMWVAEVKLERNELED